MNAGGLVFHIAGIPVRVVPFFFVIAVLFGLQLEDPVLIAAWVALMFVGILIHELGHAFAYRAFGVQPEVVLHGFGGLTFGRSLPVAKDLVVSLAGPAVGLVVGAGIWLVEQNVRITDPTVRDILWIAFFINFWWAVLNLLPILPMDGGNATNALLSLLFRRDMTRTTQVLSIATATVGIVVALFASYLFAVLLLGYFVVLNVQGLSRNRRPPGRWTPPSAPAPPPPPEPYGAPPGPYGTPPPGPYGTPPAGPYGAPPPPTPDGRPAPAPTAGPPTWGPLPDAPPVADGPSPGPSPGPGPGPDTPSGAPDRPRPRSLSNARTFGDEMSMATRSLATGSPELASLAATRARRLAVTADEHQAVDRLEAHVAERLADPPG